MALFSSRASKLVQEIEEAVREMRVIYLRELGKAQRAATFTYDHLGSGSHVIKFASQVWASNAAVATTVINYPHAQTLSAVHKQLLSKRGFSGVKLSPTELHFTVRVTTT